MQDESYPEPSGPGSIRQAKSPQFNTAVPIESFLAIVMEAGGTILPPDTLGEIDITGWCALLKRGESAVKDYVSKYNIPIRKIGDRIFFTPAALRSAIPVAARHGQAKTKGEIG